VAIDGKALRRSFDNRDGKGALHMISAWATESGLSLGQVAEDAKSNEITAIPKLLDLLDLKGCLVTIDAIGCQKDIASRIVDMGADYVLAVKANQSGLHEAIAEFFDTAVKMNFRDLDFEKVSTIEKDHGRTETRTYYLVKELDWLPQRKLWKGLRAIGMVVRKCKTATKTTSEVRFFITSLDGDVRDFARAVRQHWRIENSLHWVLDVDFREDQSRKRKDNSAINFAYILRLALSLLRQEKTAKLSIRAKRLEAGWDPDYLEKVMAAG
jgi:predicted transposase YbfD/YdcC